MFNFLDFANPLARRLLVTVTVLVLPVVAFAQSSGTGTSDPGFSVLSNPVDPNFNQLPGINDGRIVVGSFGDGTIVPNNGYVLVPQNHYRVENFINLPSGDFASQTQAIGINNGEFPDIIGFYTDDATGFTHSSLDAIGIQSPVDDPAGSLPNVTTPVQNQRGIKGLGKAAGSWTDNAHERGCVVEPGFQSPSNSKLIEILVVEPPSLLLVGLGLISLLIMASFGTRIR